jgi:hypothetical protein
MRATLLDADALIARARRRAQCDDLGGESFRVGLDLLVDSLEREARLHDAGRESIADIIILSLVNRLRVVDWTTRHPEVLDEVIEAPIFVIGPPRTGTTLLSRLLHQDPGLRSLMKWEAQDSVPPPDAATFEHDPRISKAERVHRIVDHANPELKRIHSNLPNGPTECIAVLAQEFTCNYWESVANVPSYSEWLADVDYTSTYQYYRMVLQLLQSRAPGRWSLKSPAHRLAMKALADEFPDAVFIETHRDPATVVASMCSLVGALTSTFTDADWTAYIARHWMNVLIEMSDRVDRFRDAHGDARFIDLQYTELLRDPIAAMTRIYERLERPVSTALEERWLRFLTANPQDKYGRHVYGLAELGLDRAVIDDRFAHHVARYHIPREESA